MQCDKDLAKIPQDADGIYCVRQEIVPACYHCYYLQLNQLSQGEVQHVGIIAAERKPCIVCGTRSAYTCPQITFMVYNAAYGKVLETEETSMGKERETQETHR